MNYLILVLSLLIICSCSNKVSEVPSQQTNTSPNIEITKSPTNNNNQIHLTHSLNIGLIKWSLRRSISLSPSLTEDTCDLSPKQVGDKSQVTFQDSEKTPFCSDYEIDPISTIDDLTITTNQNDLEICLNQNCVEIHTN